MAEQTIFAQIRKEQQDFMYNYISPVPGYTFNQYMTIKRAHLYLNSRYEDFSQYLNRDKLFFNIVLPPCEVAMKMLNLDTKNIKLWPMNPKSQFSTYLLEKEMKLWLKTSKMGKILNKIAEETPRYGSIVLEKTKDGAEVVDLRHLMLDPTVETINKSRFITTVHYMTPSELRATSWDNVELAVERFGNNNAQLSYEDKSGNLNMIQSTPYIKVHKRYGEVPEYWIKGGTSEKMVKALFIVAGADEIFKNDEGKQVGDAGVILFSSEWRKEYPFKDFHYMKTAGRWLGIGIPEMLFDVQVRVNELKNQKRISMEISSMHLFQTKGNSIARNVLTDLENGDIFISKDELTPVVNEERNLPAWKDEELSYANQVDKLSFAYEALRGDTNAQATLGQTQIAVAQGTSVFGFKKENFGLFLQDFFNDLVMPQLMKDLTPEHIMRFTGSTQELDKMDEAASEVYANDFIKKQILNGQMMTKEDQESLKNKAKEEYKKLGESRFLKIKKAFYNDAEFEFDFLITNEQADPITIATNAKELMINMLSVLNSPNPGAASDPRIKLLLNKFAENLGISPAEMELANEEATKLQANQQQNVQQNQASPISGGGALQTSGQGQVNAPIA